MLFYAADQKVSNVSEIRELDLSGKGVLYLKDISIFEKMTSLRSLDLSDHPEFFLSDDQIKEEESKLREGSAEQEQIEFLLRLHTIDDLLSKLSSVRKLRCDEELENYILEHREAKGFLPNLLEINKISI
jgi:hypothetical protein